MLLLAPLRASEHTTQDSFLYLDFFNSVLFILPEVLLVNMLKESLTSYSSKSNKIKPIRSQEIEGWRKSREPQTNLLPALQGTTPFTVSTLGDLHRQPKYPQSQNSLSLLYSTGNNFQSPNKKKSYFELTPFEDNNKEYRASTTNRSDWSFSERNIEKKIINYKDSVSYRSALSVSEGKAEGKPGFSFKKRCSQRILKKDELGQDTQNDLEVEKGYWRGLNENYSENNGMFENDRMLSYKNCDKEQKFHLIYGNDLDAIEKLGKNKIGKKVKRISNLGDIFQDNICENFDEDEQAEDFDEDEQDENIDYLSADSSSSSKNTSEINENSLSPIKKKYEISINGIKGKKNKIVSSEELNRIKIPKNDIATAISFRDTLNPKHLEDFKANLNLKRDTSIKFNQDDKIQENLPEPENLKAKISKSNLKSTKSEPYKTQIESAKTLKPQTSSIFHTSKSPRLAKLDKKYASTKSLISPKKKIQKKITKLQKQPTKTIDSKFQTKTTFKSTTINESTDKSLYQTSDFPSPLSVLGNSSNEKFSPLFTLAESDSTEQQKVLYSKPKKTVDFSKDKNNVTEKFPLFRQKLMRKTTIPSHSYKQQKSKNFSLKTPKVQVLDPELDDHSLYVKVSPVDQFIKNFSNSMLASLHVMIVNLTSSLDKLASDKKKVNLKNLKNFDGLYPELDSLARKEKINKRMKIELNICINMGKDYNDPGSGKALGFLMNKIKKSIISEGIKKEMLKFLENYKGNYDKDEIEKGLREILNTKLQHCRKNPEKAKKISYPVPKTQATESVPEIQKETKEKLLQKPEKFPQILEKAEEVVEAPDTLYKSDKTKIQINEFEGLNFDKSSPDDIIWKELACMNLGKNWGSYIFSSKINDSFLPTNKDATSNSPTQNFPNSASEDFPESEQDLANMASALKKSNFFKLKENLINFNDDEKFKLIIQSLSEIDPSQLASFEKTRIQKYLKKIDFYRNRPKLEISTKFAKSFSNVPKPQLSYSNKSTK